MLQSTPFFNLHSENLQRKKKKQNKTKQIDDGKIIKTKCTNKEVIKTELNRIEKYSFKKRGKKKQKTLFSV